MKIGFAALIATTMTMTPTFAAAPSATVGSNPLAAESAVLNLRGLDLATVDGQQRLAIRMDQAANAVCGERMSTIHIALGEQARACHTEVLADIRTRIGAATARMAAAGAPQVALR